MKYELDKWQTLRFARDSDGRYYLASLQQNLFGDWEVECIWGGKTKIAGVASSNPVKGLNEGKDLMGQVTKRRIRRGYRMLSQRLSSRRYSMPIRNS